MSELITRDPSVLPEAFEPRAQQSIWIDQYLEDKQGEVEKYGRILLKRKWLVLSIATAVFGLAAWYTATLPRMYTSTVNLQISSEQSVLPYKEMYALVTPDPTYLRTQAEVIKSEALAKRVVQRLKLTTDPEDSKLARWFRGSVGVTPVEGAQVLKVSFKAEDPVFAAAAVNALADEYSVYGFELKRESTTKARDYLQEELAKVKHKLEQSEQRLVTYGRAHGILLPSQEDNVTMQKLEDLNRELTKVEAEVLSSRYGDLNNATLEAFPEKLKTSVMVALDTRRSELDQKLATATAQFGPKWPEVVKLTQEAQEVRQQLANEKRKAVDQAKVEYNLAVAHRDRLANALAAQNALADKLTEDSIEYNILKREVETDRQLHEGLLQRLKETDVSAGLKTGVVHIIDSGHVPTVPSSPNFPLNLALGLTFGLALGAAAAYGAEFADRSIKTSDDVERELRLPSLGAIPVFDNTWRNATGGQLVPLTAPSAELRASVRSSGETYWESYRALRTALLFSSPENQPRSILVTSALPGEGKTTTTVNLAIALAQTGARTLIMELDMRRPTLADTLKLARDRGMSLYLSGQSKLNTEIQQTGIPNLFAIPAGPLPPNPPELIGSPRMKRALDLIHRHFDFVVIDGPPLMPVTDAAIIASQVNGVVLVVDIKTSIPTVQKARNMLKSVDANVLGALINRAKVASREEYYASGY